MDKSKLCSCSSMLLVVRRNEVSSSSSSIMESSNQLLMVLLLAFCVFCSNQIGSIWIGRSLSSRLVRSGNISEAPSGSRANNSYWTRSYKGLVDGSSFLFDESVVWIQTSGLLYDGRSKQRHGVVFSFGFAVIDRAIALLRFRRESQAGLP